ncbi:RBBP9/YdeN family alpha/beta hydrolase [Lentzea sp. NPDC051213]|uniref:RBBP9/YdeN family alpha/beta hydrolase n=1 Tax=Lentzea sp. NPDC051213 TaxID=3364126 RepID=UPI0037B20F1B
MSLPHVLLIHGWTGSGPEHWQSWLARTVSEHGGLVDMPHFSSPDEPDLDTWLGELQAHLEAAPQDRERVVLAHSLGCHLWLHHAARETSQRVDRVLLVAPPAPDHPEPAIKSFLPPPLDPDAIRRVARETRLVVGEGDPYCDMSVARQLAEALRIEFDVLPGAAHINTDAGYGEWPAVLKWVRSKRVPLSPRQ